jgi:hypothetical protein
MPNRGSNHDGVVSMTDVLCFPNFWNAGRPF